MAFQQRWIFAALWFLFRGCCVDAWLLSSGVVHGPHTEEESAESEEPNLKQEADKANQKEEQAVEQSREVTRNGIDLTEEWHGRTDSASYQKNVLHKLLNADNLAPTSEEVTFHEQRIITAYEEVSPSVVTINALLVSRRWWGLQEKKITASGSGFIWDRHGHIVTNRHVILNSSCSTDLVTVEFPDMPGEVMAVDVVGSNEEHDIAVLKLKNTDSAVHEYGVVDVSRSSKENGIWYLEWKNLTLADLPKPLKVGNSSTLKVGQTVLAVGNAHNMNKLLTTGSVSHVTGSVVLMDAILLKGYSGGPLLDSSGRLVGVNTASLSDSRGKIGLAVAVAADTVETVVNGIIQAQSE